MRFILFILIGIFLFPNIAICEESGISNQIGISNSNSFKIPSWKVEKILPKNPMSTEDSIQRARYFFRHPHGDKWLKAMWMVESSQSPPTDIVIGDDGRSYGPFQIRVGTARMVDNIYDEVDLNEYTDADIAYLLLFNFEFAAEIAARYLGYLEGRFGYSWKNAIEAYNRGMGNIKKGITYPYYNKVYSYYQKM